jgi:hypothetical protein
MTSYFGEMIHQTLTQANAMGYGGKMVGSLIEMQEKIHAVRVAAATART